MANFRSFNNRPCHALNRSGVKPRVAVQRPGHQTAPSFPNFVPNENSSRVGSIKSSLSNSISKTSAGFFHLANGIRIEKKSQNCNRPDMKVQKVQSPIDPRADPNGFTLPGCKQA